MAKNKEHPSRSEPDEIELSGQHRKGVQVIKTEGLPAGYTPPSASLSPPKVSTSTTADAQDDANGAG